MLLYESAISYFVILFNSTTLQTMPQGIFFEHKLLCPCGNQKQHTILNYSQNMGIIKIFFFYTFQCLFFENGNKAWMSLNTFI